MPRVLPDGDSSSACLEPERQAVRAVMALTASTRPRAAPDDGCANVRCGNRGHSPVRGTIHDGPTWLASCSRAARSARPAGRSAWSRTFGAGDHHGRLDALWGGAAATSRGENARSQKANTRRHIPGPLAVRFDAAGVVPNRSGERLVAGADASSGLRPPREMPNRLRQSPTVPGKGGFVLRPSGRQL